MTQAEIDVTAPIRDENDEPMPNGMTVREAIVVAFQVRHPDDERLTGEEKFQHFMLTQKVVKSDQVSLSLEERKVIKDRVGKVMTSIVIGRVWPLLDASLLPQG